MQLPLNEGILAAKAALLTLCAALGRETPTRFVIGPDEQSLETESAAQYLSDLPKPVSCSATVLNASAIKVSCLPGKSDEVPLDLTTATSVVLGKDKTAGNGGILLIGAGESMILTAAALERWTNDYAFTLPFAMTGDDPTPKQRASQIRWVLRVSYPDFVVTTSVKDLQLSPEMTEIIESEFERLRRKKE